MLKTIEKVRDKQKEKELMTFKCSWPGCGHKFRQEVGYSEGKYGGHMNVICPKCSNRLPIKEGY